MVCRWLILAALAGLSSSPALAEIGKVKSSVGTAAVQRGSARLSAETGRELLAGDWLETGKDGRISLTFIDQTRFAVGPDSRIALSEFKYDPTTEKGSFVAQIERGTIAIVSGKITKTRCGGTPSAPEPRCGMQVKTPDAVLDVRGTRFIVVVGK